MGSITGIQVYSPKKVKTNLLDLDKTSNIRVETSENGDKKLIFRTTIENSKSNELYLEGYLRTELDEYVIRQKNKIGNYYEIYAYLNLEDLEGKAIEDFESVEMTINDALSLALVGTGWTVGECNIKKKRTLRLTNKTALDVINQAIKTYRCYIKYDTINKRINIYEILGTDKGVYFHSELNLKELSTQSNTLNLFTRIIAKGKTDEEGNELKVVLENNQYSNKVKTYIWKDERYTVLESLMEDAAYKLEELSKPFHSYVADIRDLAKIYGEYSYLNYSMGDIVTLIETDIDFREQLRIVKTTDYLLEPDRNEVQLGNKYLSFESRQKEFNDTVETVNNITSDNGTVSQDAIKDAVRKITVDKVSTTQLDAIKADIGTLNTNKLNVDAANIKFTEIDKAIISKANITDLVAENIKVNVIEGGTANLQTILTNFISGENGQLVNLTSKNAVLDEVLIRDGIAAKMKIGDLMAGSIDTAKFNVASKDGGLSIVGSTMQFKDSSNAVQMQLGRDAQGKFTFFIKGEGNKGTLIDGSGVKQNAIADNLIVERMVGENAIGEKQINYSSLVTGLNKDTNTQLIKASKVAIDLEGQTLDVAFKSLKSNVDGIEIGGRNYLLNSGKFKDTSYWIINNSDNYKVPITVENEEHILIDTTGLTFNGWVYFGQSSLNGIFKFDISKVYTLSGFVKVDVAGKLSIAGMDENAKNISFKTKYFEIPSSKWTYIEYIINPISEGNTNFIYMLLDSINNNKIRLKKFKLEEGNKATDWTAAPEDTDERIETLQTSLNIVNGSIEALVKETTIETIYGGTISLKDDYTNYKQSTDSFKWTVNSLETVQKTFGIKNENLIKNWDFLNGEYWPGGLSGGMESEFDWFIYDSNGINPRRFIRLYCDPAGHYGAHASISFNGIPIGTKFKFSCVVAPRLPGTYSTTYEEDGTPINTVFIPDPKAVPILDYQFRVRGEDYNTCLVEKIGKMLSSTTRENPETIEFEFITDSDFIQIEVGPETDQQHMDMWISLLKLEVVEGLNSSLQIAKDAEKDAKQSISQLSDIANDNKLTPSEKQETKAKWDSIAGEKPKIVVEATKYSIDLTSYNAVYNSLNSYITPLLANLSTTSDIVGEIFRGKFTAYYNARQDVLNAISSANKTLAEKAQETANNAKSDATSSLNKLGEMANDNKLTAIEKQETKSKWDTIMGEKPKIVSEATKFNVNVTIYNTAYTNLDTYITPLLSDLTSTSDIVGPTFRDKFTAYYNARQDVLNAISSSNKSLAETAQTAANNAQRDATSSLSKIGDMSSDNKLTANEKHETKAKWDVIAGEKTRIVTEASKYSIDVTIYNTAYTSLSNYLTPLLSDLSSTSDIVGTTYRSKFTDYYNARQDILNGITSACKGLADTAKTAADNAKIAADNAQVDATKSINNINDMFADNKITPLEKKELKKEWDSIAGEYNNIVSNATTFTVDSTDYKNKYSALSSALGSILSNLTTIETANLTTIRTAFSNYYVSRQALLNSISAKAKSLADSAQSLASTANGTANNAKINIDNMFSDGQLTPLEKKSLKLEWDTVVKNYASNLALATTLKATTTNYTAKYNALNTILSGVFTDMITTVTKDLTAIRTAFINYYDEEQKLLNGITTSVESRVNTVEVNIKPGKFSVDVSQAINAGTAKFDTSSFTFDINGITVKNGGIRILNQQNVEVLSQDVNGNINLLGGITATKDGRKSFELKNNLLAVYDWTKSTGVDRLAGFIESRRDSGTLASGIGLISRQDQYVSIDYIDSSLDDYSGESSKSYVVFNKSNTTGSAAAYPIEFFEDTFIHGDLGFSLNSNGWSTYISGKGVTLTFNSPNNLSTNTSSFSFKNTVTGLIYQAYSENSAYRNFIEVSTFVNGNILAQGNIACNGQKTRVVNTENFGRRKLTAYETADCLFADYGEGVIGADGECIISFDPILEETINTKCAYRVYLTAFDDGDKYDDFELKVIRKTETYFVVKGKEGLKFDWNLVAKQKEYENSRLIDYDYEMNLISETTTLDLLEAQEAVDRDDNVIELQKLEDELLVKSNEDELLGGII